MQALPLSIARLNTLKLGICPACTGALLNGPYDASSQHLTCRDCMTDFVVVGDFSSGYIAGINEKLAAYYDPSMPTNDCDRCGKQYTGPAVYCCFRCAFDDA